MNIYVPVDRDETYENFDILFGIPKGNHYPIRVIHSPAGQTREPIWQAFPENKNFEDIKQYLLELTALPQEAESFGKMLYSFLFPPKVQQLFDKSITTIQNSEKAGLRIRLLFDGSTPELNLLPWEYCRNDKSFLALNTETPLVRYILTDESSQALEITGEVRVLLAAANPKDYTNLDIENEIRHIRLALSNLIETDQVKLHVLTHTTKRKLIEGVGEFAPHIFHFIGHGLLESNTGKLVLENEAGQPNLVSAEEVQLILQPSKVKLVIFNACQSSMQNIENVTKGMTYRLAWTGVPAVLGMQTDIPDKGAAVFVEELYKHIVDLHPIELAVTQARKHSYIEGEDKIFWAIPTLFLRTPYSKLWRKLPIPKIESKPTPFFTGREKILISAKEILLSDDSPSVLALAGLGGVGKSSIAIKLADELRESFPEGILWAQLDRDKPEEILNQFAKAYGQGETISQLTKIHEKSLFVAQILENKKVLIVLDQVERSTQLTHLLFSGKGNRTLITTRNRQAVDSHGIKIINVEPFTESESLEYLKLRLDPARINDERESAKTIINQVNGLPLALSIVAGYLSVRTSMPLVDYEKRLVDENKRLTRLSDWDDETQNVIAAFSLSYKRLTLEAQKVFRTLGVFDGPDFNIEAITYITEMDTWDVQDAIEQLLALSMLEEGLGKRIFLAPPHGKYERFHIYSLLKDFARLKLVENSEEETRWLFAAKYFAKFAENNVTPSGYEKLDLDWQNVIGAMMWAADHENWQLVLRAALSLTHSQVGLMGFLEARGEWNRAVELLNEAKKGAQYLEDDFALAMVLTRLGGFLFRLGSSKESRQNLEQALQILENVPASPEAVLQRTHIYVFSFLLEDKADFEGRMNWLAKGIDELETNLIEDSNFQQGLFQILAAVEWKEKGEFSQAHQCAELGLTLLSSASTPTSAEAIAFNLLGLIYDVYGDLERRDQYQTKALKIADELGDLRRKAHILNNMGLDAGNIGDIVQATLLFREALEIYEYMGDIEAQAETLTNIGIFETILGNYEPAFNFLKKAFDLSVTGNFTTSKAFASTYLASFYLQQERANDAHPYIEEAFSLCQKEKLYLMPTVLCLKAESARITGELELALSYIDQVMSFANINDFQLEQGVALSIKGKVLDDMGQLDQAELAHKNSVDILEEAGQYLYELAQSKTALASHYLLLEEEIFREQGKQLLIEAQEVLEQIGAKQDVRCIKELLAML